MPTSLDHTDRNLRHAILVITQPMPRAVGGRLVAMK
jgi:hypothetical protein